MSVSFHFNIAIWDCRRPLFMLGQFLKTKTVPAVIISQWIGLVCFPDYKCRAGGWLITQPRDLFAKRVPQIHRKRHCTNIGYIRTLNEVGIFLNKNSLSRVGYANSGWCNSGWQINVWSEGLVKISWHLIPQKRITIKQWYNDFNVLSEFLEKIAYCLSLFRRGAYLLVHKFHRYSHNFLCNAIKHVKSQVMFLNPNNKIFKDRKRLDK